MFISGSSLKWIPTLLQLGVFLQLAVWETVSPPETRSDHQNQHDEVYEKAGFTFFLLLSLLRFMLCRITLSTFGCVGQNHHFI